jgi:hypothetical protein
MHSKRSTSTQSWLAAGVVLVAVAVIDSIQSGPHAGDTAAQMLKSEFLQ